MSASSDIHIGMDSDFDHQSGSSPPKTRPEIVANFLNIATAIAECGVPVMPLTPLSKDAFLPKWQTRATTDAAQILEWTRQNPAYNCGAVARKGEYWFLDIDNPVVFGMIQRDTGHSLNEIETVVVNSSGEKQHLYFQHDARSESIGNRSLDVGGKEMFSVRAHNQYVVAAGSIHPKTGQPYKLRRTPPVGESIPVAPAWLTDWIDAHAPREPVTAMPKDWNKTFTISEGERDKWLFAQACKLRDDLYPKETVLTLLQALNTAHCVPPMDDTTVRAKVTSAFKRPPRASASASPVSSVDDEDPETVIAAVLDVPDMTDSVLVGRLGEIFDKYMRDIFPVSFGWPALVTGAGMFLASPSKNIRTNLYTCLVGPPNCGKSQAILWALTLLGLQPPVVQKVLAGSAEGLLAKLEDAEGWSRLLVVDELSHLLAKAKIDNASFPYILNEAFYDSRFSIVAARGRQIDFNCNLGIVGGVVENNFENSFGAETTGGLYDRFIFGQCPTGYHLNYQPCEHQAVFKGFEPADVDIEREVWKAKEAYVKSMQVQPRLFEIGLRAAVICAAVDGRPTLRVQDLDPVVAFVRYQDLTRKVLQPNSGENADGVLAYKFMRYLQRHAPKGELVRTRNMVRDTNAYNFGVGYQRVLDGLERVGEIEQRSIGTSKKNIVRYVRLAVGESHEA